ncbi:MAG: PKD domain-containing protein [Bacteroidota bacterium]
MKKILICLLSWIVVAPAAAQYTLLGDAIKMDCHCYTLTPDTINQSGAIWNNQKIDLSQSFDYQFSIFLGCKDGSGADGIAFVLQQSVNFYDSIGMSLGYTGIAPSVGVTIDTWQNGMPTNSDFHGDPPFDHITIQLNGDLNHRDSIAPLPINNIAGPVRAVQGTDNIEDCKWHILRIQWDAPTKRLTAYVDGVQRVSVVKDFVAETFGNDPSVVWGFTGSTGDNTNLQQVCTALRPLFSFTNGQSRCSNDTIQFIDKTISFSPIVKMYWNFGDGSAIDSVNLNPYHVYSLPGDYTVTQTVLGADGCTESFSQQLIIGSKPIADFTFNPACMRDSTVKFTNTSTAEFGTINKWFWGLGDGAASAQNSPAHIYANPGLKKVFMVATSQEGCRSDTVTRMVQVYEKPVSNFTLPSTPCVGAVSTFNSTGTVKDGTITAWAWSSASPDTTFPNMADPGFTYPASGQYAVTLSVTSSNGCVSLPVTKNVDISSGPIASFKVGPVCMSNPVKFSDASIGKPGDPVNGWWWDLGYEVVSTDQHPTNKYSPQGDYIVRLVARSAKGCLSDTVQQTIHVKPGPVARFGHSLPVCANTAFQLRDSSSSPGGQIKAWYWSVDNGITSPMQNPTISLAAGNFQVKLVVMGADGCASDTSARTIVVNPSPQVDFVTAPVCENTMATFNGIFQSGPAVSNWQWLFHDGTIINTQRSQKFYATHGNFPVQLTATSAVGCRSGVVLKTISIHKPTAFAGNDTAIIINEPYQLNGSGGNVYQWSPPTGLSNPRLSNPVTTLSEDQQYILKVTNSLGCISYDTINIRVFLTPEIYVPKAFSPNTDGLNDILKAIPVGIKEFKYFTVYSRYGEMVFTTAIPSKGWNGIYNGKRQNNGAFIWYAAGIGYNNQLIFRKGSVVLIR